MPVPVAWEGRVRLLTESGEGMALAGGACPLSFQGSLCRMVLPEGILWPLEPMPVARSAKELTPCKGSPQPASLSLVNAVSPADAGSGSHSGGRAGDTLY